MTQCDRLLNYLETHTAITPLDAWNELGIYRLGARVWDLRNKRGLNITRTGGLACCDSWGRKESDTTERLI